jgi:hypothetical protein
MVFAHPRAIDVECTRPAASPVVLAAVGVYLVSVDLAEADGAGRLRAGCLVRGFPVKVR